MKKVSKKEARIQKLDDQIREACGDLLHAGYSITEIGASFTLWTFVIGQDVGEGGLQELSETI